MRKKSEISNCERNEKSNIGEEANLHQQYFVWNIFCKISSRKMVNRWCIYRDAICGLVIMLWILHWNCVDKEVGGGQGMSMWRSCHLVSAALRVKKKVGMPSCVIISDSSPLFLFQKERVPRREDPKRMAWLATWESGTWSSWVRRAETVVGSVSSSLHLTNTEAIAWLRWSMIKLYK